MWLTVFTFICGFFGIAYLWMRRKFSYFRSRGMPEDPGYFPLGSKSSWLLLTGRMTFANLTNSVYDDFPGEKAVGTYAAFGTPFLVITDLDLATKILIKDFDHFVDRRPVAMSEKSNHYFINMITLMTGERWKTMRSIISPVFTSGKLKSMMPIIHKIGDEFVDHLSDFGDKDEAFEAKDMMMLYTLDVITNAGLGVDVNSFKNPDNLIRKNVQIMLGNNNFDIMGLIRGLTILFLPKIAKMLDMPLFDKSATNFIVDLIKSSLKLRQREKVRKNDLIDILIDALNEHQKLSDKSTDEHVDQFEKDAQIKMDKSRAKIFTPEEIEDALISNALVLFLGGFETSSNGMAICTYFLAKNQDVQERVYREIEEATSANGDSQHLDYNAIQVLLYLEQVIQESLRMYPLAMIERLCVKDYKLPESDFTVPKGMLVQIAGSSFMKENKYFHNADQFNPDNFKPSEKAARNPYAFLAFGQGPRNCVGKRFAMLQVKSALVRLVWNFRVETCEKTVDDLEPNPMSRSQMPKGGIWVKVKKR